MKQISSIKDIANSYDAFIIDLWGVMHDGTALYSGAQEALAYLHSMNKPVVFLSNAPRKSAKAEAVLTKLGVERTHYQQVLTSGQAAFDKLAVNESLGTHYYYLGPSKDEDVLDGLEAYTQVAAPEDAHFVLNAGFEYDYQPEDEVEPLLAKLKALDLPWMCINPDLEVVKIDGTRMLCAGWVARRYEAIGGVVHYIGKPHELVYSHAFEALRYPPRLSASGRVSAERAPNILAIGDNLLTDIKGANAVGIDSLLITGGIMKSEKGEFVADDALKTLCEKAGATPTYVAELFSA